METTSSELKDGKFAWLICAASFLNACMLSGFTWSSGIFYIMFRASFDASDTEVALITSLNIGLTNGVGPFVGVLMERYGCRRVMLFGSALSAIGVASSALSTQILHIYITYGIMAGVGLGIVLNATIPALHPYFNKYQRTASGLALAGFGVGGFFLPPIVKYFEELYGWRGALLMVGGVIAHMMVFSAIIRPFSRTPSNNQESHNDPNIKNTGNRKVSLENGSQKSDHEESAKDDTDIDVENVLLKNNVCSSKMCQNQSPLAICKVNSDLVDEPEKAQALSNAVNGQVPTAVKHNILVRKHDALSTTINKSPQNNFESILRLFKITPYFCLMMSTLIFRFPLSIVLTHFGSYVLTLGFSQDQVVKLYMVLGLSATFSRAFSGIIAQLLKANNAAFMGVTFVFNGIITILMPQMDQMWMLYVYAAAFQMFASPFSVLTATIVMESVPREKVPTAYGLTSLISVPGYMLGAPIGVWLYSYTNVYANSFLLAGGLMLVSGLTMIPAAVHIHRLGRRP